jgi:hypothetical protein
MRTLRNAPDTAKPGQPPVETVHKAARAAATAMRAPRITVACAPRAGGLRMGDNITWGELGCPRESGLYRFRGAAVRVKQIHLIVAEEDPSAALRNNALKN